MPKQSYITAVCGVVILVVVLLLPRWLNPGGTSAGRTVDGGYTVCQPQAGECELNVENLGRVALAIAPHSLPVMETLALEVTAPETIEAVSLMFTGRDMNLTIMPVDLVALERGEIWSGNGSIGVCTVDSSMIWNAVVKLKIGQTVYRVTFELGATGSKP